MDKWAKFVVVQNSTCRHMLKDFYWSNTRTKATLGLYSIDHFSFGEMCVSRAPCRFSLWIINSVLIF